MSDSSRPNVLFISADQLRADSVGCYGNPIVRTPNIDRLAASGVRFSNAVCQNPTCTPSRASIMTGLYPRTHRILSNGISLPPDLPTLPQILAGSGYGTSICGKAHFRPHEKSMTDRSMCPEFSGVGPYYGFEEFHLNDDVKRGEYWEYIAMHHPEHLAAAMDMDETGSSRTAALKYWKNPIPSELHQTSWIADRTIEYIERGHDEPFFLWCSFVDPHHPYNAPEPYHSMYDPDQIPLPRMDEESIADFPPFYSMNRSRRTDWPDRTWREYIASYYAMTTLIDDNVGRILESLRRTGQDRNTIIVFFADHGELLGDRGMLVKGAYHIDSLIRVPLVIYDPRANTQRHVHESVVQLIDLFPTVLNACGIRTDAFYQGFDLGPRLRDEPLDHPNAALVEFDANLRIDMSLDASAGLGTAGDDTEAADEILRVRTLRTDDWALSIYAGKEYGELFDLRTDPGEFVNLWGDDRYATRKLELIAELYALTLRTDPPAPRRQAHF